MESRSNARIARKMAEYAAARAAADAGVQRAILDLVVSPGAPKDTEKFRADGTVYAWPFANSTVHITVQDERGKINLNAAPETLLAALFGSVGVDPGKAQSLADAVADFRDADDFPAGLKRATIELPVSPGVPKRRPFKRSRSYGRSSA